ncbi:related to Transcription activator of gluconeogenesis ERT1 [Saccharomycodes ludwigii]|uniref:Related to Transcription activator of gluconeogenesis ERT1 n=1 Tax=Saccharomycodes ludwigii TaxID=36035 RepID=A0A376BAV8_9ASCO|nr:related to Transcription activator of gluconeogenesis ERT1 [Saccharomycodes ludwigii]
MPSTATNNNSNNKVSKLIDTNTNTISKRKKKKTSRACVHCAKAHATCDASRPCARCIRKKLTDTCVDNPRKKSKYLLDVDEDTLQAKINVPTQVLPQNFPVSITANAVTSSNNLDPTSHNTSENFTIVQQEQQYRATPSHIVHKPKFMSSAIDSEYSSLSNIIREEENVLNRIPVNILNNHSHNNIDADTGRSASAISSNNSSSTKLNESYNLRQQNKDDYISDTGYSNATFNLHDNKQLVYSNTGTNCKECTDNTNNRNTLYNDHNYNFNNPSVPQSRSASPYMHQYQKTCHYASSNTSNTSSNVPYHNATNNTVNHNIINNQAAEQAINYSRELVKYLGPYSIEILNSKVDLLTQHFPLILTESSDISANTSFTASATGGSTRDCRNNSNSFKDLEFCNIDTPIACMKNSSETVRAYSLEVHEMAGGASTVTATAASAANNNSNSNTSISNGTDNNDNSTIATNNITNSIRYYNLHTHEPKSNVNWPHSLKYSTPKDIYTRLQQPFSHTYGFSSLLKYLKKRFNREQVLSMCHDLSEFRPIFIASTINLNEEDMIFMEQCYQRTLLQYDEFINETGTPTIIWRRNGQISYVNDEFVILTGWSREVLLGKMTFIMEIMDDNSCLEYFKTFKQVCYRDFRGCTILPNIRLFSPIKGREICCSCCWTLKRDVFGLPMMLIGNFLPKTLSLEAVK